MKKIQSLSLLIFFILASFVSVYAKDEIYDLNYVLQLKGGFPYTIEEQTVRMIEITAQARADAIWV